VSLSDKELVMTQFLSKKDMKLKEIVEKTKLQERQVSRKLSELIDDGRIVKNGSTYSLSDENKNILLKRLPSANDFARHLQSKLDEIDNESSQRKKFEIAEFELTKMLSLWNVMKLSWVFDSKLNKKDRLDFDTYDIMIQSGMELIFERLNNVNLNKSKKLAKGLGDLVYDALTQYSEK
jgi:hypothetical protein